MEVKSFRASSLQAALARVRHELGPNAAVLETREVTSRVWQWFSGERDVEVLASPDADLPSRWSLDPRPSDTAADFRTRTRSALAASSGAGRSLVEELCQTAVSERVDEWNATQHRLLSELRAAELGEEFARECVERAGNGLSAAQVADYLVLKARVLRCLEDQISVTGPLVAPPGKRRVVALVGPTGVGKTTTIAKLAAHFHLRRRRRVGLVTVDTYRIAAVEQLRTYADIIDLPMEVVATPDEMRGALDRFSHLDLVLLDTAGSSPRDESRLGELRVMLEEARADEVHLVLSSVASAIQSRGTLEKFKRVGVTSVLLTKLDEASAVGHLFSVLRDAGLPLSYVTTGQNVPDDLEAADRRKLARRLLASAEGPTT